MTWKDLVVSVRAHSSLSAPGPLSSPNGQSPRRAEGRHTTGCGAVAVLFQSPFAATVVQEALVFVPCRGVPSRATESTALGAGGGCTSCPDCVHVLPRLLLERCVELDRLEFVFCLLSSLSLSPHLGNSGRSASSWSHGVKEGSDGRKEEGYGLHLAR